MERRIARNAAIFVLIYAAVLLAENDPNDPTECPKGMDRAAKNACCTSLNDKRQVFSVCCQYPGIVIFAWQYDICFAQCFEGGNTDNARCCVFACGLRYLKVIGDKPQIEGVDVEGLKFSFLLSVDNDTRWADTIDGSVTTCSTQFRLDVPKITNSSSPEDIKKYDEFWDCFETVPFYLYTIIDCAYYANFLKCPTYNNEVEGCNITQKYVDDCLINADE